MSGLIEYRLTGNGWGYLKINSPGKSFGEYVTTIGNPIRQLLVAVTRLLQGEKKGEANFVSGDGEYLLELEKNDNNNVTLQVTWYRDLKAWRTRKAFPDSYTQRLADWRCDEEYFARERVLVSLIDLEELAENLLQDLADISSFYEKREDRDKHPKRELPCKDYLALKKKLEEINGEQ